MAGRPKAGQTEGLKQQYGMWLGLPDSARKDDEKTQAMLAEKLGVAEKTLSLWRGDPIVEEARNNSIKVLGGNEKLAIVNALINKCKTGDHNAIRVYLEWQGEIGANSIKKFTQAPSSMQINLNVKGKKSEANQPDKEEVEDAEEPN